VSRARALGGLAAWVEREGAIAARALLQSVSASDLVCERTAFGQRIVPAPGSVLAARQIAFYDPDPDYFFHWIRDAAVIVDALRLLLDDPALRDEARTKFTDFVRFSHRLTGLHGRAVVEGGARARVQPAMLQYVRDDAELRAVEGERVLGEPRFNPDGTLDILRWARPQNDGPASRALSLLRWRHAAGRLDHATQPLIYALLTADLAYCERQRNARCFDIWEEALCHPCYTRLLQHAALREGAAWARELGDGGLAARYTAAADALAGVLDGYWSPERGHYLSRKGVTADPPDKALDSASILAVLHAALPAGPHSILDPRVHATALRLEQLFDAAYAINRERPPDCAPALGRYDGDVYFGGGAWYVVTLGFAELYFRIAEAVARGADLQRTADNAAFLRQVGWDADPPGLPDARGRKDLHAQCMQRGDAFLATVRRYTPESGALSEQFDRSTGAQRSARHLSWSYAAFVTASAARTRAGAASGR
jgi:glucoamylase